MPLPLVYHPDYVTPLPPGHRFPMPKFGLLHEHLIDVGLGRPEDFHQPTTASRDQLERVHRPAYVQAFCDGELDRQAQRRIGLPMSQGLVTRTCTAVGGTLLTARLALTHGLAANCAGGTHHAHADHGSGFCIFNDLAITAAVLLAEGEVDQILIVDLDVHQGDGTAIIFKDDPRVFTFSMHCASNFPMRKPAGDLDVGLADGLGDAAYVRTLENGGADTSEFAGLADLLERVEPDLVLYDAGVDVHADDRLGRLSLTDRGLAQRDEWVLRACRSHLIPTACVIGGGYQADHTLLAQRHATVHRVAASIWEADRCSASNLSA